MTVAWGFVAIAIVVAGILLRDYYDRWIPPRPRGFDVKLRLRYQRCDHSWLPGGGDSEPRVCPICKTVLERAASSRKR